MKFIFLILMLACSATAVLAQKTESVNPDEQKLMSLEKMGWQNLVEGKFADFEKMLAPDYQGFYPDETVSGTREIAELKTVTFKKADVSQVKVKFIDDASAIVTAHVKYDIIAANKKPYSNDSRTTTIWVKRDGKWLVVFHTEAIINI